MGFSPLVGWMRGQHLKLLVPDFVSLLLQDLLDLDELFAPGQELKLAILDFVGLLLQDLLGLVDLFRPHLGLRLTKLGPNDRRFADVEAGPRCQLECKSNKMLLEFDSLFTKDVV
jgi:hypothetical protein